MTQWDPRDEGFDPAALAEAAITANLDPSVFEKIDDRHIQRPKNWFEWCYGQNFLNVKPFPKQIEICVNLFSQFCPRCTDPKFIEKDSRFGNSRLLIEPVDCDLGAIQERIVFLNNGICPRCGVKKPELIASNELAHYYDMNGCAGMRSSKTVMTGGLVATYLLARLLLIQSPSKYFGFLENQTLHGTFVAITAGQAYETLWQAFKDRIGTAPWFQQYHAFLETEAQRLGKEKFYEVKDSFVWYAHKNISFSYCGPDIRTIRGRTRVFSGIDEKGWFDVQAETTSQNVKVRLNARETHEALIKSLRSVRSASQALRIKGDTDPIDGLNVDVSSPSSINDAIMVGLREANEDPTIYGWHYATWEMNPYVPLDSLRSEMRNRSVFERDYEAIPPLGVNQFMDNQVSIEKCQKNVSQQQMITWDKRIFVDEFSDKTMYLEVKPIIVDRNRPRILTIDTGLANNCFAVEMWCYDRDLKMPSCDLALEVMPEGHDADRTLVNFPLMYEKVVVPLLTNYRILLVVYDRWNSIDQVQRIRKDHKVEAIQYTLKWADFLQVRSRLIDSSIRIPKLEVPIEDIRKSDRQFEEMIRPIPVTHLALQTLTVREAGRKITKPINGNDDLFRCLCLAIRFLLDPEYTSKFEQYGMGFAMGRGYVGVMKSNRGTSVQIAQHERNDRSMIGVRKSFIPTCK